MIPPGQVSDDLIDFTDFLPTLLELAGAPAPKDLDGRSFLSQLKGEPGTPREWIYTYYNSRPERTKPVRFVWDQRWKLYGNGLFFDVRSDPLEVRPVTSLEPRSTAAEARARLKAALTSMPAKGQMLLTFAP